MRTRDWLALSDFPRAAIRSGIVNMFCVTIMRSCMMDDCCGGDKPMSGPRHDHAEPGPFLSDKEL